MYCEKCGMLNEDDAKFCVGCGEELIDEISENNEVMSKIQEEFSNSETISLTNKEKTVKINTKTIIIIVVVIALVIVGTVFGTFMSKRVNIEKYINTSSAEFTGYEGDAEADIYDIIDFDSLTDELIDEDDNTDSYDIEECVKIKTYFNDKKIDLGDYDLNLKNGDVIKVEITPNYKKINKKYAHKKKLVGSKTISEEIKVSGLNEVLKIDPFECIKGVYRNEDGSDVFYLPTDEPIKINDEYTMSLNKNCITIHSSNEDVSGEKLYLDCSDTYTTVGKTVTISIDDNVLANETLELTQTSKDFTMNLYKTFENSDINKLSKEQFDSIINSAKNALGDKATSSSVKFNSFYMSDGAFYIVFENENSDRKYSIVQLYFGYIYKNSENNIIYIPKNNEEFDNNYRLFSTYSDIKDFEEDSLYGQLTKVTIKGE
jgi:hypothetical protein